MLSAGFLSSSEIVEAINNGDIKIAYHSILKDGDIVTLKEKRFVKINPTNDSDPIDKDIRNYFFSCLEPDSLRFHIGAYALVERIGLLDSKKHYERRNGKIYLNVKEKKEFAFRPYEFMLIGTNEYVEVSDTIGASLFSNVRNTDIGLSHISTLIDPSWQGILQISIFNTTNYRKRLNYLDSLCTVRFHKLRTKPQKEILNKFQNRPHIKNNWWDIQNETAREIFPMRKEYSIGGEHFAKIRRQKIFEFFIKIGGLVTIATLGLMALKFYDKFETIDKLSKVYQNISKEFKVLHSQRDTIIFNVNNPSAVLPVNLHYSEIPPNIIVTIEGINTNEINYTTRLTMREGAYYDKYIIEFMRQGAIDKERKIIVNTLIIQPTIENH